MIKTNVPPETWRTSWSDEFISYSAWQRAGEPRGFVWGVEWLIATRASNALKQRAPSLYGRRHFGEPMNGIRIETNVYVIELVCHDLVVSRLATGDPLTGELRPDD